MAVWITVAVSTLVATAPFLFLWWWYAWAVSPQFRRRGAVPDRPRAFRRAVTAGLVGVVIAAGLRWLLSAGGIEEAVAFAYVFGLVIYGVAWGGDRVWRAMDPAPGPAPGSDEAGHVTSRVDRVAMVWARFVYRWGVLVMFVVLGFLEAQPGFPYEAVKVRGADAMLMGYVISVDDTSLMLLYDDLDVSGGLRRVRVDDVEARYVCTTEQPLNSRYTDSPTGLERILGASRDDPPYVPDECVPRP